MSSITDQFNRPLRDLRLSVIDRCNFRCTYCMPEDNGTKYSFLKEREWLTFEEIERLVRLFVSLGTNKVRITGGEPLLRPGLIDLIRNLKRIDGIEDLALTTNGSLLSRYARSLKDAGLNRITVSLDAVDPQKFNEINGNKGDLNTVLDGIRQCEDLRFEDIKINTVVQRGVNDRHVLDLVRRFKGSNTVLRFIEYMDVGNCNHWEQSAVVPSAELRDLINAHYPLQAVDPNYFGEVAKRYRFKDSSGEVGFISSVTQPFCRSCTRARVSADGKLFTCLFAHQGTDLRTSLRSGAGDEELARMIHSTWQNRKDRYSEERTRLINEAERSPKVEMFQIGG